LPSLLRPRRNHFLIYDISSDIEFTVWIKVVYSIDVRGKVKLYPHQWVLFSGLATSFELAKRLFSAT